MNCRRHQETAIRISLHSSVLIVAIFYGVVWCPFGVEYFEPPGSGGFALSLISIYGGLAILPCLVVDIVISFWKRRFSGATWLQFLALAGNTFGLMSLLG